MFFTAVGGHVSTNMEGGMTSYFCEDRKYNLFLLLAILTYNLYSALQKTHLWALMG